MFQRTSGTTFGKDSAAECQQEETPVTTAMEASGMGKSSCSSGSLVTCLARSTGSVLDGLALFCAERVMRLMVGSDPQRSGGQGHAFMRAVSAVVILDGCGSEGQEFRLKAFGPQYQLGSRSSSRERESLARHHGEKQIRCHHKGLHCVSGEDDQRRPAAQHVSCRCATARIR